MKMGREKDEMQARKAVQALAWGANFPALFHTPGLIRPAPWKHRAEGSVSVFLEIPVDNVLTDEVKAMLTAHNLRAVGVGLMVEPDVPGGNFHVVQQGETLSGIARKYKTTIAKLVEINHIENPDLIEVGQIIFY